MEKEDKQKPLTIDVKGLIGKLKDLKENAYKNNIKKKKEKYEQKKQRERERYYEKKKKKMENDSMGLKDDRFEETEEVSKSSIQATSLITINPNEEAPVTSATEILSKSSSFKTNEKIKKSLSTEEKRERERNKKRKQRAKLRENKEKYEEYLQKRKENYQSRKLSGKVKSIMDLKERERKRQRQKWRTNSTKYRESLKTKKNAIQFLNEHTPPGTRPSSPDLVLHQPRKIRHRANETKKLKLQVKREKTRAERYKKRLQRVLKSVKNLGSPSPNNYAKDIVKRGNPEEIKKELIFGQVLKKEIKSKIVCSTEEEKQIIGQVISGKIVRKYRMLHKIGSLLSPHRIRKFGTCRGFQTEKKKRLVKRMAEVKESVENFFLRDENSTLAPGKKDTIYFKKQTKQKRYMTDTLKNLHKKFIDESSSNISFSTFCRLRPFYIVRPAINSRNTCLCVKHTNFNYLLKQMYALKLIEVHGIFDLCKAICCDPKNEICMYRKCDICTSKYKSILIQPVDMNTTGTYSKWCTKIEKGLDRKRKEFTTKIMTKISIKCSYQNIIREFEASLNSVLPHHYRDRHQQKQINILKTNLKEDEAIVNIDFSENFLCKFTEEVQSVHFGGSRKQIALHTGAFYHISEKKSLQCFTFCGVSDDTLHNAYSIWAYIKPILSLITERNIKVVHFVSDGPTSQYRNRTNFFLMCYFGSFFKAERITWNFYESGHGKSVADGVGGALKKTADQLISYGKDITSSSSFIKCLKDNNTKVHLYEVTTADIEEIRSVCDDKQIKAVKNTMRIRQLMWRSNEKRKLVLRYLSCLECPNSECNHYLLKPESHTFCHLEHATERNSAPELGVAANIDHENTLIENQGEINEIHELIQENEYNKHDFILVKLMGKKLLKFFAAQIINTGDDKITVKFLKYDGQKFFWPTINDISDIAITEIEKKLSLLEVDRRMGMHFDLDFSKYNMG